MRLGIVAASALRAVAGGGGGGEPAGSLFHCDFTAGAYFDGSTPVALSDVISGSPAVSASGLYVNSPQQMTGAALAAFLAQEYFGVVVEWSFATQINSTPFSMENTTSFFGYQIYAQWVSSVAANDYGDTSGPNPFWAPGSAYGFEVPSPVRAAVDRTAGRIAISVNGEAAVVATGDTITVGADAITLGGGYGGSGFNGYIRKLTLYASLADADLVALSAL